MRQVQLRDPRGVRLACLVKACFPGTKTSKEGSSLSVIALLFTSGGTFFDEIVLNDPS